MGGSRLVLKNFIHKQPVTVDTVKVAERMVDNSGVLDMLERWRAEDGWDARKGGRPAEFSHRQVLVLWVTLSLTHRSLLITSLAELVCRDLDQAALARLGLPPRLKIKGYKDIDTARQNPRGPGRSPSPDTPQNYVLNYSRIYKALHRAKDRLFAIIDPYAGTPYSRRLTKDEFDKIVARRDMTRVAQQRTRSNQLLNALTWQSILELDEPYLRAFSGRITTDATLVTGTRKWLTNWKLENAVKKKDTEPVVVPRMSSEPDGGVYHHDTADHGPGKTPSGKVSKPTAWGYEAHLSTMVMTKSDVGQSVPHLICGISFDRPGVAPGANAVESLRHLFGNPEITIDSICTDRGYFPKSLPENFQGPLREQGIGQIGDYQIDQLGLQFSAHGAIGVDGKIYCASMPKSLIDATKNYRNDPRISFERWQKQLEKRKKYQLRVKDVTPNGLVFHCPGRGPGRTIDCDIVDNHRDPAKKPKRNLLELTSLQVPDKARRGKVCTNSSSVMFSWDVIGRYYQDGPPHGTPEWAMRYGYERNISEQRNAALKNSDIGRLDGKTGRLMRGWVAQFFITTLCVVRTNIELIRRFESRLFDDAIHGRPAPEPPPKIEAHQKDADDDAWWYWDRHPMQPQAPPKAA